MQQALDDHIIYLANGWVARFSDRGEFRMDCNNWNLVLTEANGTKEIRYFEDKIVLVNDDKGVQAANCIEISKDGNYGYLSSAMDEKWVIDFERLMLAPHRWNIHHNLGNSHITVYEQPAFKQAQNYVMVGNKLIYLTFPFAMESEFDELVESYLQMRRKQLDEIYFLSTS